MPPDDEHSILETNARAKARGQLKRWLHKRYQRIDLTEIVDEPDPISLRQIFIPMRVSEVEIADENMGTPDQVREEILLGQTVWDLLAAHTLIALSGRPGSGKTTLVQAIVVELCGEHNSLLRKRLIEKHQPGILPLPITLRYFSNLEQFTGLDDLLEVWWNMQVEQAQADKIQLDLARLQYSFTLENYPALLLFDGIDEVGGLATRRHVLQLAREAHQRGYRVLVTGRPSGLNKELEETIQDIDLNQELEIGPMAPRQVWAAEPLKIYHLLPFAWPQIKTFIQDWYQLRNDWKIKQQQGIHSFLAALQDIERAYLLTLARRPIFLALMALIHCTRNEIPGGRAALYKTIVDLYLHRQERHRRLKWDIKGQAIPHWPENEPRLVLGYLALLSQQKSQDTPKSKHPYERRVIWHRADMLAAIAQQLNEGPGRFTCLTTKDSAVLLDYFLYPAGLLVEVAKDHIQFSHLSFQEYLCAEFLYERADIEGLRPYLEKNLFPQLEQPGWDEVGLLLLSIRAMKTRNEGHFELLGWLNPVAVHQANLLFRALTSRELSFTVKERIAWLPLLLGCALIHPHLEYGRYLARITEFREPGLALLSQLFQVADDVLAWQVLIDYPQPEAQRTLLATTLHQRWLQAMDDTSWHSQFCEIEARAHALLGVLNQSGWVIASDDLNPIADVKLQRILAEWLEKHLENAPDLLWLRDENNLPIATLVNFELDALLPAQGPLWQVVETHLPLDAWLLQGERIGDEHFSFWSFSQPCVLLSLYPQADLPKQIRLALCLYQVSVLVEAMSDGQAFDRFSHQQLKLWRRTRSESPSSERSLQRSLSLSLLWPHLSLSRSRSRYLSLSDLATFAHSPELKKDLIDVDNSFEKMSDLKQKRQTEPFKSRIQNLERCSERFSYHHAAHDWFQEQANSPNLMKRRKLIPHEPLPKALALFDDKGLPLAVQKREHWLQLQRRLMDNKAILELVFPKGLKSRTHNFLVKELTLLQRQPWSPQAGVKAILADWPETEATRECSLEVAEKKLQGACEDFLDFLKKTGIKIPS